MSRPYWNETLETLPAEQLRKLESAALQKQMAYVYATSPYYRKKFDSVGLKPADIQCQEDLAKLPFTEKNELAQTQREGELIGPNQCASMEDIIRIVGTGGTSGQPMRLAWTQNDVRGYNEMGARALWAMGCRPSDFVVNCFNYSIYAGGVTDHMAFETLGATVLPYGVGNSRRLLDMKADMKIEKALYSTPSYAIRLASVAEEMGINLRDLNVKKGFFSGEAGMQVPGYRERIENLWGMEAHDLYGMAELGVQSAECEHNTGLHFSGAGEVIAELINPDTEEVIPMEHGQIGELVFTNINREASPLVRMRTHDYVEVYTDPCPCGRTGFRFHTRGRTDDMVVIKGVNIFPMAIQKTLLAMQPRLTGEFQMVLDKAPPIDYLPILKIEVASDQPVAALPQLTEDVALQLYKQLGFSANIEFVKAGEIASEHKTKRVIRNY